MIETPAFAVYRLNELEPGARMKAIGAIAEKLGGDWWDSSDDAEIEAVILYTLANEFGTSGHGEYGVADFPGIPGVRLVSWDLDRGDYVGLGYVGLDGVLTRVNAPRLPWADGADRVVLLAESRSWTSIHVEIDEAALDPNSDDERSNTVLREAAEQLCEVMREAVLKAMRAALKSGRQEMDYKTSAEYAEDMIEANEYEFRADGTPYFA